MNMYRTYRTPYLWRDMDRLQRNMNRLFNLYSPSHVQMAPSYPPINIWVNDEGQFVSAEMPGLRADEVEISVEGDRLTISGERSSDDVPEDVQFHRKERGYGKFSRTVQLPYAVDVDLIDAHLKDGQLSITLPKAEAEKPKQIPINN